MNSAAPVKVNIQYMSKVRNAAGISSEIVEVPVACTIEKLIDDILCPKNEGLKDYLLEGDCINKKVMLIYVGDQQVAHDSPLELKNGDEVIIMSPITGG